MPLAPTEPRIRQIGGVTLRLLPAAGYCARYTPAEPVAGFAFDPQDGMHAFASDKARTFRAAANGLAFTPAGCSVYSEARQGGEYLTVSGAEGALAALLPREGETLPSGRFTGRVDAAAPPAARHLRRLLIGGADDPAAYEAALADFLAAVGRCGGSSWRPAPQARSLTAARLKIVDELIEARMSEALTVADMAAACGLSPGFFLRAFRSATGQTPHRYLMERRLAHARRLLAGSDEPAAEVALRSGFANQAHMTAMFTHSLGVAPGGYRKISRRRDSCATIAR